MSKLKIKIHEEGDLTIWVPVSSRSPRGQARAFIPFAGLSEFYIHGYKADPEESPYFEALRSIQKSYIEGDKKVFTVKKGPDPQRKDAWRHGRKKGSSLLSPTSGWVEVPLGLLEEVSEEELSLEIESSGKTIVKSQRLKCNPEGPMFRLVSREMRTFQIDFRTKALELWEPRCALSGATCLLEAAHIKGVAASKRDSNSEMLNPYNSIILNVALHGLLDEGLISFTDEGVLLVSRTLSQQDQSIFGVDVPKKVVFNLEAVPFLQYHRNTVFRGAE